MPAPATSAARRRLSFNEKHALDTLPAKLDALPAKMDEMRVLIGRLRVALDDPGLYARDPARFAKLSQGLADQETKLAGAEDEWLELELLREEVGG